MIDINCRSNLHARFVIKIINYRKNTNSKYSQSMINVNFSCQVGLKPLSAIVVVLFLMTSAPGTKNSISTNGSIISPLTTSLGLGSCWADIIYIDINIDIDI